jgi:hypothetical protein
VGGEARAQRVDLRGQPRGITGRYRFRRRGRQLVVDGLDGNGSWRRRLGSDDVDRNRSRRGRRIGWRGRRIGWRGRRIRWRRRRIRWRRRRIRWRRRRIWRREDAV